jgi:hypothetical protein
VHSLDRRGQVRVDPGRVVRIAAGFDKRADGVCRFGLTQQDPVHAAAEDLTELPSVEANISGICAVDRGFDDDGRRLRLTD